MNKVLTISRSLSAIVIVHFLIDTLKPIIIQLLNNHEQYRNIQPVRTMIEDSNDMLPSWHDPTNNVNVSIHSCIFPMPLSLTQLATVSFHALKGQSILDDQSSKVSTYNKMVDQYFVYKY